MESEWYLRERSSNRCCPGLTFVWTHKRLMPAKINVTSHISLHTWSQSHWVLPKSWRAGNYTGHQDDNKNTYEANILCSLTLKVFKKNTIFRIIHLRPPSPKCPRPIFIWPPNWGVWDLGIFRHGSAETTQWTSSWRHVLHVTTSVGAVPMATTTTRWIKTLGY